MGEFERIPRTWKEIEVSEPSQRYPEERVQSSLLGRGVVENLDGLGVRLGKEEKKKELESEEIVDIVGFGGNAPFMKESDSIEINHLCRSRQKF